MNPKEYRQALLDAGVMKEGHFLLPDGRHSDIDPCGAEDRARESGYQGLSSG